MANPRRFAYVCFLLLALVNCGVLGKIRGANRGVDNEVRPLDDTPPSDSTAATVAVRSLKNHEGNQNEKRKQHKNQRMHHNMMGGAKAKEEVAVHEGEVEENYPHHHHPHNHPEQPDYDHVHEDDEYDHSGVEEPEGDDEYELQHPKGGAKGGAKEGGAKEGGAKGGGGGTKGG
ncbi:expressed unknown protein (Partial), partial [Seminavis robusta]